MIPALMFGNVLVTTSTQPSLLVQQLADFSLGHKQYHTSLHKSWGAIFGQALVVATHRPYYLQTEKANNILGTFSTISSIDQGTKESRFAATVNGFINEFVGSFVLFFAALGMTKNFFGAEVLQYMKQMALKQVKILTSLIWQLKLKQRLIQHQDLLLVTWHLVSQ